MALNRLRHVVGAQSECILRLIHPSKPVSDTYPNRPKGYKLLGLVLICQDIKVIRRGMEPVGGFTFRHEDIPNEVMYSAKRCVIFTIEGPLESFFPNKNERRQQQITRNETPE